jgi:GNAT superfamily N-acetyltransferase
MDGGKMRYEIRKATPNDIRPAIDHTPQASIEFDASDCNLMFVALDGEKIVGVIGECGDGHISIVSVDGVYQRQRIATALMSRMVCALKLRGFDKITLNSPPEALPFFKHFGFVPADIEQKLNGLILTPMLYEPNEIWDVYDHNRNKTGRFIERGRAMAAGDYHVIVNV